MPYSPTAWADFSTPVDAAHLNKIETGLVRATESVFNVKEYGAKGDGVTDDTAAINAAWAAAKDVGILFFPEGNYIYNGSGLTGAYNPIFVGADFARTIITLGATSRFYDTSAAMNSLLVRNLTFQGGVDVIRSTFTGANVIWYFVAEDCRFNGYTGAAISNNSSDFPYWKINRCAFYGANYTSSIGIALSGWTDSCAITECDFAINRIHVKLRLGGNNAYIRDCDFLRFGATAGVPRVDVWVVPNPTFVNSGAGFLIDSCKFGNENFDAGDYKILYADEDTASGSNNGTYFPKLSADSTGVITGHRVTNCGFYGNATPGPMVYSTTPEVRGCYYGPIAFSGGDFTYVLQFRTPPTYSRLNNHNIFGPFHTDLGTEFTFFPKVSNGQGMGYVIDPNNFFDTRMDVPLSRPGAADPVDYVKLLATGIRAWSSLTSVTLANVADVYGGIDASELTFTAASGNAYGQLTMGNIVTGQPVWVELDVKQGSSSPLTMLMLTLIQESGSYHFRREIEIPSVWRRVRMLVPAFRLSSGQIDLNFATNGTESGKVQIGRVRVYHAREPLNVDGVMTGLQHRGTTAGLYGVTPVARAGAITSPTTPSAGYVQAEATSMKTAVDAIRTALANIGITS